MDEKDLLATFGTSDLYEILGVEKTCSASLIKKAYHKKSLELHPDRQQEDKENFTVKFQYLHQIYTLLSDTARRAEYDQDGTISQDDSLPNRTSDDWSSYWRELFRKVTLEDIVKFEESYKGSEEERSDVKKYYNESKGDMDTIMSSIMLVRYDEEVRIREIINDLIAKKEVKKFKAFTQEDPKKRKRREKAGKKEEKEAAKAKDELGEDSLFKAIAMRQEERSKNMDSFFAQLEEKYAQPAKKRKTGKSKKK